MLGGLGTTDFERKRDIVQLNIVTRLKKSIYLQRKFWWELRADILGARVVSLKCIINSNFIWEMEEIIVDGRENKFFHTIQFFSKIEICLFFMSEDEITNRVRWANSDAHTSFILDFLIFIFFIYNTT